MWFTKTDFCWSSYTWRQAAQRHAICSGQEPSWLLRSPGTCERCDDVLEVRGVPLTPALCGLSKGRGSPSCRNCEYDLTLDPSFLLFSGKKQQVLCTIFTRYKNSEDRWPALHPLQIITVYISRWLLNLFPVYLHFLYGQCQWTLISQIIIQYPKVLILELSAA